MNNKISFVGEGIIDGKEYKIEFMGKSVEFDQTDKQNPFVKIRLLRTNKEGLIEIKTK